MAREIHRSTHEIYKSTHIWQRSKDEWTFGASSGFLPVVQPLYPTEAEATVACCLFLLAPHLNLEQAPHSAEGLSAFLEREKKKPRSRRK